MFKNIDVIIIVGQRYNMPIVRRNVIVDEKVCIGVASRVCCFVIQSMIFDAICTSPFVRFMPLLDCFEEFDKKVHFPPK